MLSVKAGAKMYGRLEKLCDGNITMAIVKKYLMDKSEELEQLVQK